MKEETREKLNKWSRAILIHGGRILLFLLAVLFESMKALFRFGHAHAQKYEGYKGDHPKIGGSPHSN